jgi:glucose/arabinose dehydrogenase
VRRPVAWSIFPLLVLSGCKSSDDAGPGSDAGAVTVLDAPGTRAPFDARGRFCDLPGSLQFTAGGKAVVPGGFGPNLSFLTLPAGFCVHYFANVGNVRQIKFAPSGELFAASPTTSTTGGGAGGQQAIVVFPDDDGDGYADSMIMFLGNLPSTQGLLFANDGFFYYQDGTKIRRLAYKPGDRTPRSPGTQVVDINVFSSQIHWPKMLDQADDGTIYVSNGGDESEDCDPTHPFRGGILKLDGSPNGSFVSKGFRNPIAMACEHGKNQCFAVELSRDYSSPIGGREKLVPIRQGDDWGHPCCSTRDLPFKDLMPAPDCSKISPENVSFVIGHTPFGVAFETGKWPAPYSGSAIVPLHGAAGDWSGSKVVAIEIDTATGLPKPGTDLTGAPSGAMSDFATGWDDGTRSHGRPANVAFSADGRLFLGNDNNGDILWIAPLDLAP